MNPSSSLSSSTASWFSSIVRGRSEKLGNPNMTSNANAGDGGGSVTRKNHLRGVLFKYGPKPSQVAFKTGDFKQQVIFIGGLNCGFLATEYLQPLSVALENEKWSLVQLLLSSSYTGYGTSSLKEMVYVDGQQQQGPEYGLAILSRFYVILLSGCLLSLILPCYPGLFMSERWYFPALIQNFLALFLMKDSLEIDQLVGYLINKENSEGVVLLGHSTGCQDIVHYMQTNAACSRAVRAAILQAPVSDRESRATLPETAEMIDLASSMLREGRGMDLMPREANPDAPITAYRYHSLCAYMGDDDMFSSDLSEDQLRMRLGHMANTPCQVIFSMADEYVPEYVDGKALVERLCRAMGGAEKVEIEWGNHSLSNRSAEAVEAIIDFVKRDVPKGWDDPWS